ncbi:hypothetical protein M670_02179 [Schinkia azotoformans MEV2011]|uniref:Uncharacterized protein n=1 Tax=Schinkia azotoformans MEV2011 TaxID=1348973 RepID=A0A072NNR4_SCHAZ|nr:hypothetical protein [Schinkia azotoformans]KEF38553.1 hypothetical protein M670_02179 [Schinkia azotoformans MEV2011]MEC1695161.1 hypothetical protein [Schinkia azotoformans]MEC1717594.1 hypothetical protein [Schinkia azotoformans]MEC1723780.1 hypothetical protein [Schinkia azotoformans]MEC1742331.1 hypothetical protein [Schinkia azotoformans]
MPNYYYHPEVKLLLVNHSNEKVKVLYDSNQIPFNMPLIGPRPPFYTNPQYVQYYPKI